MIYTPSVLAVVVFAAFVAATLWLSFFFARKTRSAAGYFAAGGSIPWFVNGVAFAGDYLSAASFLGICGMIAFYGYDGFLYSIGYLAGWIVALFVVAEPLKRLGRYTFADALDARFHSPGIKLAAGISALVVSLFYLIPQMVGAGALVKPLLGFAHWQGVLMVGAVVVMIVVTAGMVSTTYVQFIKGSLLVVFSAVLTVLILSRGFSVDEEKLKSWRATRLELDRLQTLPEEAGWKGRPYVRTQESSGGPVTVWRRAASEAGVVEFYRAQTKTVLADKRVLVNGRPQGHDAERGEADFMPVGDVLRLPDGKASTGALGPIEFFCMLEASDVLLWSKDPLPVAEADGATTTVYFPRREHGTDVLQPGGTKDFSGLRKPGLLSKLNFLSLMLALFCGTASLPHILIRYYTVKDQAAARKSTVVGIGSIGFFYVLTLFMGLGAMTSGAIDVTDSNMAAPLLAKTFGDLLFAVISAIAFTTVLGTVSGLIVAASGAVVHDLLVSVAGMEMNDHEKIRVGRIAAVFVGAIAIALGIVFEGMNVGFLVGWAFSVAASANLPSLVMLLFWRGTTKQGIVAAILVGLFSSLGWILASSKTYEDLYGLPPESAWIQLSQPGIVTIPLGFLTLVVVSLMTRKPQAA